MNRVFKEVHAQSVLHKPIARLTIALVLFCAPLSAQSQTQPQPKPTPKAAPVKVVPRPLSAVQYRQFLNAQKQRLEQIEKRAPRDVRPVLKALDNPFIVKRADGATQQTKGGFWNKMLALPGGRNFKNLPKREVREMKQMVETQISALDDWITPKNGAYFLPADSKTIIAQLEQSGQIRTGPLAWQQSLADFRKWIGERWKALIDWLDGLRPARTPNPNLNMPDISWLMPLFWVCVVALLGAIFFFVFRSLGGMEWIALKRRPKRPTEFEGEDAQLLKLPPDELRDRAEAFARKGNFREALRHRFLAILVNFDARGVWRYDLRRTNWEHIAGLRRQDSWRSLVAPLSDLTRRFDRVRYGGGLCDESEWIQFQADANKLEDSIPKSAATDPKRELAGASR